MAAADKYYKDLQFKIDNAAGSITDITTYVTSQSISGDQTIIDDLSFGTDEVGVYAGAARATYTISFLVNTTTEGIFGPLVGNRTSVTKTFGAFDGVKWHTGEALYSNVTFSGDNEAMVVGSANYSVDGTVTHTSVAPS